MPRVHFVKKARKDNPRAGVKKGESYYWWSNRLPGRKAGIKHYSKTPPKPSQVTGNPYVAATLSIEEDFAGLPQDVSTIEELESVAESLQDLAQQAEELGEEQEEKLRNMPQGLQEGDTGQLLQSRVDGCSDMAEALRSAADEISGFEIDEDGVDDSNTLEDATKEQCQNALENALGGVEFYWGD